MAERKRSNIYPYEYEDERYVDDDREWTGITPTGLGRYCNMAPPTSLLKDGVQEIDRDGKPYYHGQWKTSSDNPQNHRNRLLKPPRDDFRNYGNEQDDGWKSKTFATRVPRMPKRGQSVVEEEAKQENEQIKKKGVMDHEPKRDSDADVTLQWGTLKKYKSEQAFDNFEGYGGDIRRISKKLDPKPEPAIVEDDGYDTTQRGRSPTPRKYSTNAAKGGVGSVEKNIIAKSIITKLLSNGVENTVAKASKQLPPHGDKLTPQHKHNLDPVFASTFTQTPPAPTPQKHNQLSVLAPKVTPTSTPQKNLNPYAQSYTPKSNSKAQQIYFPSNIQNTLMAKGMKAERSRSKSRPVHGSSKSMPVQGDSNSRPFKGRGKPIEYSAEYLAKLRSLALHISVLIKHGYTMKDALTVVQLQKRKRCKDCKKVMPKDKQLADMGSQQFLSSSMRNLSITNMKHAEMNGNWKVSSKTEKTKLKVEKRSDGVEVFVLFESDDEEVNTNFLSAGTGKHDCSFHPGFLVEDQMWSCCSLPASANPCENRTYHVPFNYDNENHAANWSYNRTPFPKPPYGRDVRAAVSLDCEMGISTTGESELIRVSLVDYFTGEVLLDKLVYPDADISHFNTKYSGITRVAMEAAKAEEEVILGRDAARVKLWQFVGPETVVVMHGGKCDMDSLRWYHYWIVDTHVMELVEQEEGEGGGRAGVTLGGGGVGLAGDHGGVGNQKKGANSLKALAKSRLGRVIQDDSKGHDSVEDALAARDLAHWAVANWCS